MALMFVTAFAMFYVVKANPSYFLRVQSSTTDLSAATSGGVFQVPGTATTTLTLDTGTSAAGSVDSAVLLTQYVASSTNGTLNADIQYSQDGTTYYADTVTSTSTIPYSVGGVQTIVFPFASSTITRGNATSSALSATSTRKIIIPTPTRYVRAVFYSTPGANGNGTFWAEFVAKKQSY